MRAMVARYRIGKINTWLTLKDIAPGVQRNQQRKWHRSNIYSGAPMPYMQRITWSGIALHAGDLPGYPASHGCIRLKSDIAIRLWNLTKRGTRVIVTYDDVRPVEITLSRRT